jgi:hypothetical protein
MNAATKLTFKIPAYLFYCCVLLAICYTSFRKPEYNWDMLPYMAVAISYDKPQADIHAEVYATLKKEVPAYAYNQLTDSSVKVKHDAFVNTNEFKAQMPFYVIKPLYTGLIYAFHKAGFSLVKSTVMPSVVGYLFIGLLLLIWMQQYLSALSSVLLSTLIMLLPPLQQIAKLSTPDALSALAIFSAVYYIIQPKQILLGCILLILSVFIRLDNIIFSALLFPFLYWTGVLPKQWNFGRIIIFSVLLVACYFVVTALASSYGWGLLYYNSFSKHMNDENDFHKAFSIGSYIKLIKKQITIRMLASYLPIFIFMVTLISTQVQSWRKGTWVKEHALPIFCLGVMIIRFFLQPTVSDRFYVPYYLIILLSLISLLASKQKEKLQNATA